MKITKQIIEGSIQQGYNKAGSTLSSNQLEKLHKSPHKKVIRKSDKK
jgi:hypothetical protein